MVGRSPGPEPWGHRLKPEEKTMQTTTRPRHSARIRRAAVPFAAAVLAAVPAVAGASPAAETSGQGASLAVVRQVTAKYHDVQAALADGYVPASPCVAGDDGVMGIHYANPALLGQPVDVRRPAMLLYVPTDDGLELAGVEYFQADADQDLSTDDDRPTVLGQAFDGPMAGHGGDMPIHYDLHVWVWRHNPAGTFAEYNPALSC
jgi:hypothetical protein